MNKETLAKAYENILVDMDVNWLKPRYSAEIPEELKKLSGIFLPSISDNYAQAKNKIMIIGRESAGWEIYGTRSKLTKNNKDYTEFSTLSKHVERAMVYHEEMLDVLRTNPGKGASFFHLIQAISQKSGIDGLAYVNLLCFDWDKGSPLSCPFADEIKKYSKKLFRMQIDILQPEIIIFANGISQPSVSLRKCFLHENKCEDWKQCNESIDKRQLEQFYLDWNGRKILSYRIWHPAARFARAKSKIARDYLVTQLLPSK